MKTLRILLIVMGFIVTFTFVFLGYKHTGAASTECQNSFKMKRDLSQLKTIEKSIDLDLEYLIEESESEEENKPQQLLDSEQFSKLESEKVTIIDQAITLYEKELSRIKSTEEYKEYHKQWFLLTICSYSGMFIVVIGLMLCKDSRAIGVFLVIMMLIAYTISISSEFSDVVW